MNRFVRALQSIDHKKWLIVIAAFILFQTGIYLYNSGYICFSSAEEIDPVAVQWQQGTGACFDGEFLWVANENELSVQKVDPASGAVVATVDVGGQAYGMAFDGKYIWVSVSTGDFVFGHLVKINAETLSIKVYDAVINNVSGYGDLYYDGKYLWVGTDGVSKVCRTNGIVIRDRLITSGPIYLTSDGNNIWAVADQFYKIDPGSDEILDSIGLIPGDVGGTLLFDGEDLWHYRGSTLYWLDLDASGNPIEITEYGMAVYGGTACTDGTHIWLVDIGNGSVAEFDIEAREVIGITEIDFSGSGSIDATVVYDGSDVWVVNRVNGDLVKLSH